MSKASAIPRKMTLMHREDKPKNEAQQDAEEYRKVMDQFIDDYND